MIVNMTDTRAGVADEEDRFDDAATAVKARRAWSPHEDEETAAVLRRLMVRPWLIAGRDDDSLAALRRNLPAVRAVIEARLGWTLIVERDFARLRKKPPSRLEAHATPGPSSLTYQWMFLLVAAAEGMVNPFPLRALMAATQSAAAEAGVEHTGDIVERRAIVAALKELINRGVLDVRDGQVEAYVGDDDPSVLLDVHHGRLLHVIANYSEITDPTVEPEAWLAAVGREPDVARRMRQRLCDDSLVHADDLDDAEADWLSRRVRGDDGGPVAAAFGMHVERRVEGAAFVVGDDTYNYDWELGPIVFPGAGTVAHAALLVCAWSQEIGVPSPERPGWLAVLEDDVGEHLVELAGQVAAGRGGWRAELAGDPAGRLRAEVRSLLEGLDLLRVHDTSMPGESPIWEFSPAVVRWDAPTTATPNDQAGDSVEMRDEENTPLDALASGGTSLLGSGEHAD
jgi:uncharacterized protein (TIGR02678 family)